MAKCLIKASTPLEVASLLSQGQHNEGVKSGFIPSAHHLAYGGLHRHLDALKMIPLSHSTAL